MDNIEHLTYEQGRPGKAIPWLRIAIHLLGWLPLIWLIFDALTGQLSVNPIQAAEQLLGQWGFYFLVATLTVTPLYTLTGWRDVLQRRRALGLYAFLYVSLHVLTLVGLDYGFQIAQVLDLILGKAYTLVGAVAFLLLIPLAVTSFDYFIRTMGKNWRRLHWLIYPAALIAVLHYALAQKGDILALRGNVLKPFLWGVYIILLLVLRLPPVRRWVSATRRKLIARYAAIRQRRRFHPPEETTKLSSGDITE